MKKNILNFVLTISCCLLSISFLHSATISIQRIGCVDMNRLLDQYPDAKRMKDELSTNLNIRKDNIKLFESQISSAETEIENMEGQLQKYNEKQKNTQLQAAAPATTTVRQSTGTIAVSTGIASTIVPGAPVVSAAASPQVSSPTITAADITAKKAALQKQENEFDKYKAETKKEEKDLNNKVRKNILGKIYDAIRAVANEEGITVLVDSNNLIYGEDAEDITDKVLKKLK